MKCLQSGEAKVELEAALFVLESRLKERQAVIATLESELHVSKSQESPLTSQNVDSRSQGVGTNRHGRPHDEAEYLLRQVSHCTKSTL